ncbi:MAG: permease prefix domain 1-containing protein [Ruminococcus sp.]
MEPKLREYVERLFSSAPKTKQAYELKEEIVCNVIERYHDLIEEGKAQGDAYNQAIAGIGDINELITALKGEPAYTENSYTDEQMATIKSRFSVFRGIAVALYILCVVPNILFGMIPALETLGPAMMFLMISTATGLLIYGKMTQYFPVITDENEKSKINFTAITRAVAVGMYISAVTPCIALAETPLAAISPIFMFMMIAGATVLIIFSGRKSTYTKTDDTMVENFKEWNSKKKSTSALYKILVAILWVTTSFVYLYITFITGFATATVTWIVFLIAVAVQNLIRSIFDYVEATK